MKPPHQAHQAAEAVQSPPARGRGLKHLQPKQFFDALAGRPPHGGAD